MPHEPEIIAVKDSQPPYFLGVDIGGTSIKLGVVDSNGAAVEKTSIPTEEEQGPQRAMQRCAQQMRDMVDQCRLQFDDIPWVGLASPGTMDIPAGRLLEPHNLPHWYHFDIRDCLAEACGKPITFLNDANSAAYGEFWVGRGRDYHSLVMLTLGTGVGGGVIVHDISVDGEHSHGSECGHIIVDPSDSARMCYCGKPGHLEAYCSATAVVDVARETLAAGNESTLRQRMQAGEELTALMIYEEASADDDFSRNLILETARWLGIGIVSLMHVIDPGAVVLGGAMDFGGNESPVGRMFIERIRQEVQTRAFPIPAKHVSVEFASLGSDAGFLGAAAAARAAYLRSSRE
jgi:glucokinase